MPARSASAVSGSTLPNRSASFKSPATFAPDAPVVRSRYAFALREPSRPHTPDSRTTCDAANETDSSWASIGPTRVSSSTACDPDSAVTSKDARCVTACRVARAAPTAPCGGISSTDIRVTS